MTISVYYAPPRVAKRTSLCWCVTVLNNSRSETARFATEAEAHTFAAKFSS